MYSQLFRDMMKKKYNTFLENTIINIDTFPFDTISDEPSNNEQSNVDLNYIIDNKNLIFFEKKIEQVSSIYNAGLYLTTKNIEIEKENAFVFLIKKIESYLKIPVKNKEYNLIGRFCINYFNFIEKKFKFVINNINKNHDEPLYFSDCKMILHKYIHRFPCIWEQNMLWNTYHN
jgi:hypothetical protein